MYVANYHKLNGLEQHPFISSNFCRPEVWHVMNGFFLVGLKILTGLRAYMKTQLENPLSSSWKLVAKFSSSSL